MMSESKYHEHADIHSGRVDGWVNAQYMTVLFARRWDIVNAFGTASIDDRVDYWTMLFSDNSYATIWPFRSDEEEIGFTHWIVESDSQKAMEHVRRILDAIPINGMPFSMIPEHMDRGGRHVGTAMLTYFKLVDELPDREP